MTGSCGTSNDQVMVAAPTKPQTTIQNITKVLNLCRKSFLERRSEPAWVSKFCQIEAKDCEELPYF